MSSETLCDEFNSYFRVVLALTPELQKEVFCIRYNVFAKEFGWEELSAEEMERDDFDRYSIHCLIYHNRTNTPAGCVRLVIPDPIDASQMAPFEKYCAAHIAKEQFDLAILDRVSYGEASRLAVPSSFRRRKDESRSAVPFPPENTGEEHGDKRHFPHIAMGLYLAGMAIVDLASIDYVFAMMEPRLARHLHRFGVLFQQGSDVMDYHGLRALYYIPKEDLTRHLTGGMKELYESIRSSVLQQLVSPAAKENIHLKTHIG
ncbi:PEP-CTERM/exosortase system-associated acyltransferase [Aestuariirhabdus litorea]|uniref:PEP-CTERM/exosortase system-associated acyltransferase n=1 Tax=Aestuariirhabdus litorea TaxID=2528527 RepID=A0A3P3VPP9_9GAMM|nr:PEP-CTERM/exosortase system-associated acyltransferase [Aestuariirhabdus litorea]RRJ84580.1 PEP-CTERM/exosortase system-associated acyltransferase [Aestuariirhabdus litorea]RWW97806.1 PEP-CTERM/exosortase system-associated acyltransferase [Endozoicomonadaceae bacterium GTF-13]